MILLKYVTNKLIFKALFYKKGSLLVSSIGLGSVLNILSYKINIPDEFFGISISLICILSILIILDSLTGIIASRYEGDNIESGKLFYTFFKFFSSFLFFWLMHEIQMKLNIKILLSKTHLATFYGIIRETMEIITYSIFLLLSLREWISIGENIERRYKKKFYLFQIVERVFDIVENKLIKWLENKEICKTENEKNNDNNRSSN